MRFNVLIVSDAQLDQEASERALIAWYDRDGTHDVTSKWDYLNFVDSRPALEVSTEQPAGVLVQGMYTPGAAVLIDVSNITDEVMGFA